MIALDREVLVFDWWEGTHGAYSEQNVRDSSAEVLAWSKTYATFWIRDPFRAKCMLYLHTEAV